MKVTMELDRIITNIHQTTGLELSRPQAIRMLIQNFNKNETQVKRKPKSKDGLMFI